MNDSKQDERREITVTRPLGAMLGRRKPGYDVANTVAMLFEQCEYEYLDSALLDVSTIRIRIDDGAVTATARHGA